MSITCVFWRLKAFQSQQSPVILDLCLRKTRAGKSRDYRDVGVRFEFFRFEERFRKKAGW